ncbi:MAG: gfo/Idh/MocA family oxidoreductase [Sphaerobacteraceae bacterium]|nr:MAG: gfo/Idh/MocA family oxidoreductase [Sphaerobacteraceae bacterium]
MTKLRAGLIGTGTIAHSAHLPAMQYLGHDIELIAVADIRAEAAQAAVKKYGAETWYSDYRELLNRDDIDFVDICTPEFLHCEQVVAAAEAGKHILCEKPMAATVDEADRMIAAAKANDVMLMIGHSRRFTDRYRNAWQAVAEGRIGNVQIVRENERRPVAMYSALDLATGYWSPDGDRPWISDPEYTEGAALTNAVHEMDLARWFAGADALSVQAESRIAGECVEVADFLTYTITFKNGVIGGAEIVNNLPSGYPYFHMLEVYGDQGSVRADDPDQSPYAVWSQGGMQFPVNFDQLLHIDNAYIREIGWFVRAIQIGAPPPLDPWDARQALALSLAAVESSKTGRTVFLSEMEPSSE